MLYPVKSPGQAAGFGVALAFFFGAPLPRGKVKRWAGREQSMESQKFMQRSPLSRAMIAYFSTVLEYLYGISHPKKCKAAKLDP